MKQLTLGDLLNFIADLTQKHMSLEELKALPIYIGDDDELNGIHCAWYNELVDVNNSEYEAIVEMINENRNNHKITGKAILIS